MRKNIPKTSRGYDFSLYTRETRIHEFCLVSRFVFKLHVLLFPSPPNAYGNATQHANLFYHNRYFIRMRIVVIVCSQYYLRVFDGSERPRHQFNNLETRVTRTIFRIYARFLLGHKLYELCTNAVHWCTYLCVCVCVCVSYNTRRR